MSNDLPVLLRKRSNEVPYEPLRRNTDTQHGVYASIRNFEDVGGYVYETMDDMTPPARSDAAAYTELI
ncbi:hypothetical protein LSAT2_020956 [Lamellibrachia satsuma]|nr:hypothetical protein LSAT2_020956 [Lamellibrachia satsuma]